MIETSRKIWEKLEENIGRCILFRDAAMKEMLGKENYTLQFATLSVPERVEEFLDNAEGVVVARKETGYYSFSLDNVRVEIQCFDASAGFEESYDKMFDRPLRCENLGININGQFNKNKDAYRDIMAKELHLATANVRMTEVLISKIVRNVLLNGFVVGDDIVEYVEQNKIFDDKAIRGKFLFTLCDNIKRTICTWERVAEALKLVGKHLPAKDFIQYTKTLDDKDKNDRAIRNYLYSLFIPLGITGQELYKIFPKEPTLEYFDSLATNIDAKLGDYKTYIDIKKRYGEEFLELLIDVQESVFKSLGLEYTRVSDETFDRGELFFKDDRFWCTLEDMKVSEEVAVASTPVVQEETMDVSKGNAAGWIADKFNNDMYSDAEESDTDKVYLDDEVETEAADTGIDMSALDAYEEGSDDIKESDEEPQPKVVPPKQNEGIMNSQRGHESTVLNSGGV